MKEGVITGSKSHVLKMKIVMLGEGRVGKTSMLQRFIADLFDDACESTTKASMFASVKIPVSDSVTADISIWDTAGQERYHALGPIYYRDAHGAVLVYDITDYESYLKVKVWLKELQQVVGNHNISVVIVGNKIDLERQRRVPLREAEEWAKKQNAKHFSVSAKLGLRTSEPFEGIARDVSKRLESTVSVMQRNSVNPSECMISSKTPIGLGAPPPRSRCIKINSSENTVDEDLRTKDRCSC